MHISIYDCPSKGPCRDCPLQKPPGFQYETPASRESFSEFATVTFLRKPAGRPGWSYWCERSEFRGSAGQRVMYQVAIGWRWGSTPGNTRIFGCWPVKNAVIYMVSCFAMVETTLFTGKGCWWKVCVWKVCGWKGCWWKVCGWKVDGGKVCGKESVGEKATGEKSLGEKCGGWWKVYR